MKYSININQYSAVGLGLDIIDLAILDSIASFILSGRSEKIVIGMNAYYWVSAKSIIEDLPLLGISTERGINKRVDKLIDAGMLSRCPENERLHKSFIAIGPRYYSYEREEEAGTKRQNLEQPFHPTRNESSSDNNTNDYYIPPYISKDIYAPLEKSPAKKRNPKEKKEYAEGVSLTEGEYGRLCDEYGKERTEAAIRYLSSYKREKGYKTKDDNLTLRRWVFKAVDRDAMETQKLGGAKKRSKMDDLQDTFDKIDSMFNGIQFTNIDEQ